MKGREFGTKHQFGQGSIGFLVVKGIPGLGVKVKIPERLTRDEKVEWAKETLRVRFYDHVGWLHIAEDDHEFLRGWD